MDIASTHRSRRSFPNLQQLSLAPLSSRFPIDDDGYDQEPQEAPAHHSSYSYIQGKSAPTTPGILTRDASPSHHRKSKSRTKVATQDSFFPPRIDTDLPLTTAKSTSALVSQGRHHSRRSTGTAMLSPVTSRKERQPQPNDEWLHRAGLVIASGMRESKGQSWLVSRDSSTSLVDSANDHRGEHFADDEFSPATPRYSRSASRAVSRVASARTSRRGSRVGSRPTMDFMTPMESRSSAAFAEGYFDEVVVGTEPDFVDAEDEGAVDDEEVSRLAQQKGFGLGGLVDRLVGFSLFNVDEDGEDTEEEDHGEETVEEAEKRKKALLKKRREQLERAASSSAIATARHEDVRPPVQGDDGGWQDAAWLLSVASKVLY